MSRDSSPDSQPRPRQDLYSFGDPGTSRPDAVERRQPGPQGTETDHRMLREASLSNPSSRDWFQQNKETRNRPIQLDQNGMYTVTPGDCLSTIAERMLKQSGAKADGHSIQATVDQIAKLNNIQDPNKIADGSQLRLMAGPADQATQPRDGQPVRPQHERRPIHAAPDLYGFGDATQPQAAPGPAEAQQYRRPAAVPSEAQQYRRPAALPAERQALPPGQTDYPQYGVPDQMPRYAPQVRPHASARPMPADQYASAYPQEAARPGYPLPGPQPHGYDQVPPGYAQRGYDQVPPGYAPQGYPPGYAPQGTDMYGRPYQPGDIPVVSDLLRLPGEIANGIVSGISRGINDWGNFFHSQTSSNNCFPATMAMMHNDWSGNRAGDLSPFNRAAHVSPGSGEGYRGSENDIARELQATTPGLHTEVLRGHSRQELAREIRNQVDQGHTLVVGIQSPYHAGNNHYIYVAGRDKQGRYIIGDPGNHNGGRLGRSISEQDLLNRMMSRHGGPRAVAGWSDAPQAVRPGTAAYNMAMARRQSETQYAQHQDRQQPERG